jgi:hypothetical protein
MKRPATLSRKKFKTFVLHVSRNEECGWKYKVLRYGLGWFGEWYPAFEMIIVPLFTRFKQSSRTVLPLKEMTLRPSNTPRTCRPAIWLRVSEDFDPQQQSLKKYKTSQLSLECCLCFVEIRRTVCVVDVFPTPSSKGGAVWNVRWCEGYLCRLRDGQKESRSAFGSTTAFVPLGWTMMAPLWQRDDQWRNKRWHFLPLVPERVPLKV